MHFNQKNNFKITKKNNLNKLIMILFFFLFSVDISFCEELDNTDISSENHNQYDYKKFFIYTLLGIITVGIFYYLFFSNAGGNNNQEEISEIYEAVKNIPANVQKAKPLMIYEKDRIMTSPYDFYKIYDCYNSVNVHLSKISNEITDFAHVYSMDLPIVHMSNTIINEIHCSTKLSLQALKNLPKDDYIAFAHYNPSFSEIYYQILTAEEFQTIIKQYNLTKPAYS